MMERNIMHEGDIFNEQKKILGKKTMNAHVSEGVNMNGDMCIILGCSEAKPIVGMQPEVWGQSPQQALNPC